MDLRVKKTRRSILNAFLMLRANKPLEKITVKELAELAMINKATFYLHFRDIYDLSDTLERELVCSIIDGVTHPEYLFTNLPLFVKELTDEYFARQTLIHTLFSGNQVNCLPSRIEQCVKEIAYSQNPALQEDMEYNILLSYCIYGGYYAYIQNEGCDLAVITERIGRFSHALTKACDSNEI